jgi:hypothetical protein
MLLLIPTFTGEGANVGIEAGVIAQPIVNHVSAG